MEGVTRDLGKVFGEVVAKTPHTRVYSPIALAEYATGAPLGQVLAEHLMRPVSFTEAVNRLYDDGVRVFIEAGGRSALSALVRDTLAERQDIVTLASNDPKQGELASLEAVLSRCENLGLRRPSMVAGPTDLQERIERMTPIQLVEEIQRLSTALAARLGTPAVPIHLVPVAPAPVEQPVSEALEQKELAAREEAAPLDRSVLVQRVVSIYQRATDYPAEVFELDADLEAELGIDSVKQLQILAMLQKEFQLPELGKLRVKDFNTISRVVDMVAATSNASNLAA
jgi:acyl transferase domain-containing protein